MDKAERQRVVMVVLLTVLIGYVGYYGVGNVPGVSSLRVEAAKLQGDRDRLREQVKRDKALVANLDRIKKEREALELQLRELARRLPGEHESPQVLRSVEALAGKSGLTVAQVKRRPSRPQELYVEIPMEVGVGGGYSDLLKFAQGLSQLPRLVTLNELRLQGPARGPAQRPGPPVDTPGNVHAQLVAVVFQALPESAVPAPAGSAATPARKP